MGDEHGNFAEGQETSEGERHESDFAEGQQGDHQGHDEHHGNFAEGQEMEHDDEAHGKTGFAEGQKER